MMYFPLVVYKHQHCTHCKAGKGNREFKSEPFWEVFATFNIEGKKYEGKWEKG